MTDETVAVEQCDRDAVEERAIATLDVFLAAYESCSDTDLARPLADDDLLTWGDLRTILAALAHPRPALDREAATDAAFKAINGNEADPFINPEAWDFAQTVADAILALATPPASLPGESTNP